MLEVNRNGNIRIRRDKSLATARAGSLLQNKKMAREGKASEESTAESNSIRGLYQRFDGKKEN